MFDSHHATTDHAARRDDATRAAAIAAHQARLDGRTPDECAAIYAETYALELALTTGDAA